MTTDHDKLRAALVAVVDCMRRSDPDYAKSHSLEPCYDHEWDAVLELAEEALDPTP